MGAPLALISSTFVLDADAAFSCKSEEDCNLAGDCLHGSCVCDAPWTGEQCTHMHFELGPSHSGLQTSGKETWGASILQENASSFHLFASYFEGGDLDTWKSTSVVTHAWAPNATGPYVMDETTLIKPSGVTGQWDASNCHNPTVHKIGSEYVIFYIGMDYTVEPQPPKGDPRQTIGAAYSSSLWGPWQRMDQPLLEPAVEWELGGVSNPAMLVNSDGSVVMFWRGNQDKGMGVATAPQWRGPYTRRNNNESIIPAPNDAGLEDMYVWRTSRNVCHMVLHQHHQDPNVGAHIFTSDPECVTGWRLAQPAPSVAYNLTASWSDGTVTDFLRRERPQLVFTSESKTPMYLSSAVEGGCSNGQRSCSIVVPLHQETSPVSHDTLIV